MGRLIFNFIILKDFVSKMRAIGFKEQEYLSNFILNFFVFF
jgi:hypothetical protein